MTTLFHIWALIKIERVKLQISFKFDQYGNTYVSIYLSFLWPLWQACFTTFKHKLMTFPIQLTSNRLHELHIRFRLYCWVLSFDLVFITFAVFFSIFLRSLMLNKNHIRKSLSRYFCIKNNYLSCFNPDFLFPFTLHLLFSDAVCRGCKCNPNFWQK